MVYVDDVFSDRITLTWDEDERGWLAEDGVGESGSREVAIHIQPGVDDGSCKLVATIDGEQVGELASRSCGDERIDRQFDPTSDFISATFEGFIGYDDEYAWILASSQLSDCRTGVCNEATPCRDECGSHPSTVTATIVGTDQSASPPTQTSVEIDLHYWETVSWTGDSMGWDCGYIGIKYMGECQIGDHTESLYIIASLSMGNFNLSFSRPDPTNPQGCNNFSLVPLTESCDPYFGDSGMVYIGVDTACWSCQDSMTEFRITVTE